MRTVYVMGAGASKHAGFPLISGMGKQWLDWMAAYPNGYFRGSVDLVVERFGSDPNVEDVITEMQSSIHSLADSEVLEDRLQRTLLGNTLGQLNAGLREWFRQRRLHGAHAYAEFADNVIQPGDVVITFNYDDSLERELRRAGKWDISLGYGFMLGNAAKPSPVVILKLHGSVNWLASIFGGVTSGAAQVDPDASIGQHPVIHKADLEFLGYSDFEGHTYPGGGAFPSLILPGRQKEFFFRSSLGNEWKPFFEHLWSQAGTALNHADRVVICGYSMLPVDERACDLILGNPDKRIKVEIVCGSQGERIENDFRNAGYEDIAADPTGYFEDWVERRVQEQRRKENLKVDQVVRELDGGTPVMKLPQ
jgi:hypothetical protein